jgi:hypothetical protein
MEVSTSTASGITVAGQLYFESDTEILTMGDGATAINFDFTPNVTYTFPSVTSTLAILGANTFTASQTFTTSVLPVATTTTIGSADAEWGGLYLGASKSIYFEVDQSVYLTSSASTLTLTGNFVTTGTITGPTADDPYIALQETNGQDWWIGMNDSADTLEFRWSVTAGTTPIISITEAGAIIFEGDTDDAFETTLQVVEPTADVTISLPNYTGAVPIVILQEYDTTTLSATDEADVTGGGVTVPDGWFTAGKALKFVAGGTNTGANGTISVILDVEGADAMKLTTADGAAGDWVAEFTIIATGAATQKIIGKLIAEGGVETKVDYATGTVDTATAGTIPMKLQLDLGHADDSITCEYVQIWHWNIADAD